MNTIVNTEQEAAWNGVEGQHWADNWQRWNRIGDGVNDALFDAADIAATHRVLDVGCGTGRSTRLAARRAYSGAVTGIDLSRPMLERAQRITVDEELSNIDYIRGDAQVHDLGVGVFDRVISRAGIMFFSDPHAGFGNLARAMRGGAKLAIAVPASRERQPASWATLFQALAKHVTPPQPDGKTRNEGPMSLSSHTRTRELLHATGFTEVTYEDCEFVEWLGADVDDAVSFLSGWGLIRHWLRGADAATTAAALGGMGEVLEAFAEPEGVQLRGATVVYTARRA